MPAPLPATDTVSEDSCILVPVYHPYRWMVPWMVRFLEKFWPGHPTLFFCGLTSEEAGEYPHIPIADATLPRNWAAFTEEACGVLLERGFRKAYFIGEDHIPMSACHAGHLKTTIPDLMDRLGASYFGLLGWDNRRQLIRNPIIDVDGHQMMHLINKEAPRFHLHPGLFRLDVLKGCLAYLRTQERQTPHGFEKACDKIDAALPEEWKRACYQIKGEEFSAQPIGPLTSFARAFERFYFHRMMGLYPLMRKMGVGPKFWKVVGFENFFYPGPLPMFYSGIMVQGKPSPFFVEYIRSRSQGDLDFQEFLAAIQQHG